MTNEKYLDQLIKSYYAGMYKSKIKIIVGNMQGEIIFTTNEAAKLFEINPYQGNIDQQIRQAFEKKITNNKFNEEFKKIRPLVLENQNLEKFFLNIPIDGVNRSFVILSRAIFNPTGEVIGAELMISDYAFFPLKYHLRNEINQSQNHKLKNFKLTEREYLILFYLALGYTQDEIADAMEITRGTVARMIHDKLYVKFNITQRTSEDLIKTALKLGIMMNVPLSILQGMKLVKL